MSTPERGRGTGSGANGPGTGAGAEVSSARLMATLAVAGALAGLLIVSVYGWARPRIEEHRARVLAEAIHEVLDGPAGTATAFLVDGRFTTAPPPGADTTALERVYVGYDEAGRPTGIAVPGAEPGFQDEIRLLFGYDPDRDEVLGMTVLEMKETPGLGDKIEKDSAFVAEFQGVAAPLTGVKPGRASGAPGEVDIITGATISSQTVIDIINHRLEALGDPLRVFWSEGAAATP